MFPGQQRCWQSRISLCRVIVGQSTSVTSPGLTFCRSAGKEGDRLEVLGAATEALTLRPAVHFPAAITAACLTCDRSGWLARNAHTITGNDRTDVVCAAGFVIAAGLSMPNAWSFEPSKSRARVYVRICSPSCALYTSRGHFFGLVTNCHELLSKARCAWGQPFSRPRR